MELLKGKVAFITGGTRGIGFAIAKTYLENGATVVVCGSRKESAEKAVNELKKINKKFNVEGIYPDLTNYAEVEKAINDVAKKYGVKEIYYYNFKLDRGNHNHYYENIVRQLTPYLQIVEDETLQLYAPTVIMVQNGNILYYDDETTIVRGDSSVEDYWTYLNTERKRKDYAQAIERYQYESTGQI